MRLGTHVMTGNVAPEAGGVRRFNGFAINLRQQNVSDGLDDVFGSALQQVGQTHLQPALPDLNVAAQAGEGIELNAKFRQRHTRPEIPMTTLKKFLNICPQDFPKLSRPTHARSEEHTSELQSP